jgi:hypothetical protein
MNVDCIYLNIRLIFIGCHYLQVELNIELIWLQMLPGILHARHGSGLHKLNVCLLLQFCDMVECI